MRTLKFFLRFYLKLWNKILDKYLNVREYVTSKKGIEDMKKITKIDKGIALNKISKLRVAAYARVSTVSYEQKISLEAQREYYRKYIKSNADWEFVDVYYDFGISGTKKDGREGLMKMIDDCEKGRVDYIITKSISRFARNTIDCLEMVRKLNSLNIHIYFEKENINTRDMESELMLSILSSLAENESMSISENNKWSIKKRFEKGTYIISYPPYGYEINNRKMEIVNKNAEVIKDIFNMYLSGEGTYKIAKQLNQKGILSPKGVKWTGSTINKILSNEKYVGDVLFQKTYTDKHFKRHINRGEEDKYYIRDHHEAIINRDDFEKVQAIKKQRTQEKGNGKNTGRYRKRYSLSGKIKCGECNSTFRRKKYNKLDGEYIIWSCYKHIYDKNKCSMKYILDEDVKVAFIILMNKLKFGYKEILGPLLDNLQSIDEKDALLNLRNIEEKIEKNEDRLKRLLKFMSLGVLEPAIASKERYELGIEKRKLYDLRDTLINSVNGDKNTVLEIEKLINYLKYSKEVVSFSDELFERFVEEVIVRNRLRFEFKLKCKLSLVEEVLKE